MGVSSRRPVEETAAAVDEVLETRHPPTPTTTHPDNGNTLNIVVSMQHPLVGIWTH